MKKLLCLATALVALGLGTNAHAAAFTAGNLVVYRVGDGTTTNILAGGSPVFLDEYTTSGTLLQSIAVNTNSFCAGSSGSEGMMTLSVDGQYLVFGGHNTNSAAPALNLNGVLRVIGRADAAGGVDTSTKLTDIANNTPRGAVSTDGNSLWMGNSGNGTRYCTIGATTSTQLTFSNGTTNVRGLTIFSNQLYASAASVGMRVYTIGTGLPTTATQTCLNLPGIGTAVGGTYGFALFNLTGGAGPDTLYVADDGGGVGSAAGAIYKWSLVGATWTSNGFVTLGFARGITGKMEVSGSTTNVHLYCTSANGTGAGFLIGYVDTAGWSNAPTGNGGLMTDNFDGVLGVNTPAPSFQTAFRGVAFAPASSFTVSPGSGFTASGFAGGPFTPTNQVFTLSNLSGSSINWTATHTAAWVNLSSIAGTIGAGSSTTITAALNATANSLAAGAYTDSIGITNTSTGLGNTTRTITLNVTQLGVTPSIGLTASGDTGGPFSPSSQIYTLTNSSPTLSLTWGASKLQSWVTLSATSGTMGPNGSTNVTVSINTGANSLLAGVYQDTVSITNASPDPGSATRIVNLSVGFGFCDDFSTFSSGNIVGQQNWQQHGAVAAVPIQISGGKMVLPSGQTADNQDIFKDCTLMTNTNMFFGMTMTFSAVPTGGISYITALISDNGGTFTANSFANYRLSCTNVSGSTFALSARTTGQAQDPFTAGALTLTTGTAYRVIIQTDSVGSNMTVYVNPTSNVLTDQTAYLVHVMGTNATPSTGVGGVLVSQFASATVGNPGVSIGQMCLSPNYATVYTSISGAPPSDPFVTWQNTYFTPSQVADANYGGPNADPFGKGMSNTNQFLAGFNPTNSAAYLHILTVTRTDGTNMTVTYLGAAGDSNGSLGPKLNVLDSTLGTPPSYTSTNFVSTGLTNSLNNGTGLGQQATFVHTNGASQGAQYYRVRVLP